MSTTPSGVRRSDNIYGLICPSCGSGTLLQIQCTAPWILLMHDGSYRVDYISAETRWTPESQAGCANCQWTGKVKDLVQGDL